MSRVASITALAALVSQAAAGSAVVKNACPYEVYVAVVDNTPGSVQTIASGATFSDPYRTNPNGGGISIKLGHTPNMQDAVTQFEYTLTDTLWYDLSNINGYPFVDAGMTLVPSNSACRTVVCPAGVQLCSAVYNVWNDDHATAACTTDTNLVLELCSGQVGNTPVDVGSPPQQEAPAPSSSSVAPPPPPAPSPSSSSVYSAPPEPTPTPEQVSIERVAPEPSSSSSSSSSTPPPPPPPAPTSSSSSIVEEKPEPTTSAAPVPPPAPEVHVVTTFVTEVFTIFVRSAAPEPTGLADRMAAVKRDHVHKRAEHRHHFHRHADTN